MDPPGVNLSVKRCIPAHKKRRIAIFKQTDRSAV
jgi:hypothetical protein